MSEYHKIQSVFKRDERGKFMHGEWSTPELAYLAGNEWEATEKVDGTNVRVYWDADTKSVRFGGRTDNAQMPVELMTMLQQMFTPKVFGDKPTMCLYGEGYGRKIQKVGSAYIPDAVGFILFDVNCGGWWLRRESVHEIAESLGIKTVPVCGRGSIQYFIAKASTGDVFSEVAATTETRSEGYVLRPVADLFDRRGHRIITKVKLRDFQ
jgi:ATP-dependent RNA circularization protein (DNA/RNA ligase family)